MTADNPDYPHRPLRVDARDTLYLTGEIVRGFTSAEVTTDLLEIEAEMSPEHLARLRSTRDRLYRVARVLGEGLAADLLQQAITGYMTDGPPGVTDRLEAALEVLENA